MERRFANTALGEVYYCMEGDGPDLVLLHSSRRSSRMYLDLIPDLAKNFRVIIMDYPGAGNSAPLPEGTTMQGMASCVAEIIDLECKGPVSVFGLHTGNKVGSALAADHPDKVSKFILAGQSHSLVVDPIERNERIIAIAKAYIAEPNDGDIERIAKWGLDYREMTNLWWTQPLLSASEGERLKTDSMRQILDQLQSCDHITQLYQMIFDYAWEIDLTRITCPTMVLELTTPHEDADIGRRGPSVSEQITGSTLKTIEAEHLDMHRVIRVPATKDVFVPLFIDYFG